MHRARGPIAATSLALWLACAGAASGQIISGSPVPLPIITGSLLQGHQDSAANTADVVTLTGVAGQTIRLYSLVAVCSAGTASLVIESPAGTTIMDLHNNAVTATPFLKDWAPGLTGAVGANMVITLGTCGNPNVGHLSWQTGRH
jgi:hypothetical protein